MHSYKPVQSWLALQVFYPPDSSIFYQTPAAANFHSADVSPCAIFLNKTSSKLIWWYDHKNNVQWGRNTSFVNKSGKKKLCIIMHTHHFNKKVKADTDLPAVNHTSELRAVTCHMGSQCYLPTDTSERAPPNPSHAGWYSIYLPWRNGRLSWPSWLDSAPGGSWTSDLSITSPTPKHCTTKTTQVTNGP